MNPATKLLLAFVIVIVFALAAGPNFTKTGGGGSLSLGSHVW